MYQLTDKALAEIEMQRPGIISKLALSLQCSDNSINRYLRENEENGDLTKYAALEVLQAEIKLPIGKIIDKKTYVKVTG